MLRPRELVRGRVSNRVALEGAGSFYKALGLLPGGISVVSTSLRLHCVKKHDVEPYRMSPQPQEPTVYLQYGRVHSGPECWLLLSGAG